MYEHVRKADEASKGCLKLANHSVSEYNNDYANSNCTFTMSGGSITGNTSAWSGGGVSNSGTFTMSGGSITENTAKKMGGGVFDSGTFNISGNPTITGNVLVVTDNGNTNETKNNVQLYPDTVNITINAALNSDSRVGVTLEEGYTSAFTSGLSGKGFAGNFTSDNAAYSVVLDSGEAKLIAHTHNFEYAVNGATITATCANAGCGLSENKATLTIVAPTLKTVGGAGSAEATITGDTAVLGTPSIVYKNGDEILTGAPTAAGNYTASITAGGVTASVAYTIKTPSSQATISTDLMSGDDTRIAIEGVAGQEYIIVPKGTEIDNSNWSNPVLPGVERDNWVLFDNLLPATEYTIYTRVAETDTVSAGEAVSANVHTNLSGIGLDFHSDLVGSTVTVMPEPEGGYTYQWYQDTVTRGEEDLPEQHTFTMIADATSASYTLADADVGKCLAVKIKKGDSEVGDTATELPVVAAATATFNSKGGTSVEPQTNLAYGSKLTKPADPTRSGYTFGGWMHMDEEYSDLWDFNTNTVEWSDTTLYAKWNSISTESRDSTVSYDNSSSDNSSDDDGTSSASTVSIPASNGAGKESVSVSVKNGAVNLSSLTEKQMESCISGDGNTFALDLSQISNSNVFEISAKVGQTIAKSAERSVTWLKEESSGTAAWYGLDNSTGFLEKGATISVKWLNTESKQNASLTESQKTLLQGLASPEDVWLFDLGVSSGGKEVHDLNGETAIFSVAIGDDWDTEDMRAVYLDESGAMEPIPMDWETVNLADGAKQFARLHLSHFSMYALVRSDAPELCPKDGSCPLASFSDLVANSWYHHGVHYVLENGIMAGMGNNRFAPNSQASRAQIATILWRMEGSPIVNDEMPFLDVADGTWYADAIRWASNADLIAGFKIPAGKAPWPVGFKPNDSITREQLVAMLYRYAKYKGVDASSRTSLADYNDAASVSDWATDAVQWAVSTNIITGKGNSILDPKGNATRAEIATVIMRYCEGVRK